MNIFHRYIIKEHIAPFFFAFFVIMFVLVLKLMLQMMDMLLSKDVGISIMMKLFFYNLAWMVALVIPMSVLVSSVMSFGRLGASSEIVAMKAAGISMYRFVSPIILLSILLTIIMIWFNNKILPEANYRAKSLNSAVVLSKPMLSMKNREGQFINDLPGITMRVSGTNTTTNEIFGVTLFKNEENGGQTIILAERGYFIPNKSFLCISLKNGEIHQQDPKNTERYNRIQFDQFNYILKGLSYELNTDYKSSRNDRSMTSDMMRGEIAEINETIKSWETKLQNIPQNDPAREAKKEDILDQIRQNRSRISEFLVEIHKKNSIPFAAIVFVLIGSAIGILVRTSGASIGIGMSIGFFMIYYLFLIAGESAGDRLMVSPWLAMWAPNIVLGSVAILLFIHAARR